jgi:L-histidine Nalpha-methyltransferase
MNQVRTSESLSVLRIDRHLDPGYLDAALRADALSGLTSVPKQLPPKWFYDEAGSELFDQITRLSEYYPTRAERSILVERAEEIADLTRAATLVELGSGTSEKTRLLLDALWATGELRTFAPFDVAESVLSDAGRAISREYSGLSIHAVVGDFEHHLRFLPRGPRRLIAFLGSTIGNLFPAQRARFFSELADGMGPQDALLLGTDLVKDPARLVAAYDDASGVTARFNLNILSVLNGRLGAHFDPATFEHVARWNEVDEWMDISLRSTVDQSVRVEALDLDVPFAAGETMQTEISAKFRREVVEDELRAAGLSVARWWTDEAGDFALSLSFPDVSV